MYQPTEEENRLSFAVVNAAYKIHTTLGPGLLESVYENCLLHELTRQQIPASKQVGIPIVYEDLQIDNAYRIDLLVGGQVIVEIKAVEKMSPLYQAQLLTYLKLSRRHLGLLINFNVPLIKEGIQRLIS